MSVLRIIKDLIGVEDINWGDSSTTFNRETHLGGSVALRYVDAEVIPSTGLGGYIGDHLHLQNTDSLTTSATFGINASGVSVVLDGTGLTASRTFTFPDTGDQELVGATDLASTAASLGGSLVGVRDASGYFTGTDVETVLQEVGDELQTLSDEEKNKGRKTGFKLGYSTTTAVTISGGSWGLAGTADLYVYMPSAVTFTFGPAGSNAQSDALGANEIHYIYIDDSAVVAAGTGQLTAAEFINSTDVPSFSDSKHGWYASGLTNTSSNDRCIGAVLTDASSLVLGFSVVSGQFYRYNEPVVEFATAAVGTTFASLDVSSSVPSFATMCKLRVTNVTAGLALYFDTVSSAVTPEAHTFSTANAPYTFDVSLSTSQLFYYYGSGANDVDMDIVGYYVDSL
jgi:hypothetical protein